MVVTNDGYGYFLLDYKNSCIAFQVLKFQVTVAYWLGSKGYQPKGPEVHYQAPVQRIKIRMVSVASAGLPETSHN